MANLILFPFVCTQIKASIQRERERIRRDFESRRRAEIVKYNATESKVKDNYREKLAAVRAKIEEENASEVEKREKLLEAERLARDEMEREFSELKSNMENKLEADQVEALRKETVSTRSLEEFSREVNKLLREKAALESKLSALAAGSENRASEGERLIHGLRSQVRDMRVEIMSQQRQIKEAEQAKEEALASFSVREQKVRQEFQKK
eukprot:1357163-Amorphochlora_amoeboformis.AAC.1